MTASALLKSIPGTWKNILQRDKPSVFAEQSETTSRLMAATGVAKWAYSELFKFNCRPEKAIAKWERELHIPRNLSWENVFVGIYATSDDISLRWLQLRIIHRIIPTSKRLKLFGILQSDRCQHFPSVEEDITHLFWSCPEAQKLWDTLGRVCNIRSQFNATQVLLNISEGTATFPAQSIKLLVLITKQYIWQCHRRSM